MRAVVKSSVLKALMLVVAGPCLLGSPAFANEPRLQLEQKTYEIEVPKADGSKELVKVELIHARPKSMAELIAAEEWIKAEELKAPSKFRMVIGKYQSKLFDRFSKLFPGKEVKDIQISQEIADRVRSDLVADSRSGRLPLKLDPKYLVTQSAKKVEDYLVRKADAWTTDEHTRLKFELFGNQQRVTDYDLLLGVFRFTGNFAGYSLALATTLPDTGHALIIASTMAALSASVQVFANPFGDWLERKENIHNFWSGLAKYPVQLLTFMADKTEKISSDKIRQTANWLQGKLNYYTKYAIFEAGFVSALYGLLTHYNVQPEYILPTYLAYKVSQSMLAQGVLEEHFLKSRTKDRENMSQIRANVKFSNKLFIVSVVNNSAIALSSIPGVGWIGNVTLMGLATTGFGLFAKDYVAGATDLKGRALGKCEALLNSAFPPPPILPGLTVPAPNVPRLF